MVEIVDILPTVENKITSFVMKRIRQTIWYHFSLKMHLLNVRSHISVEILIKLLKNEYLLFGVILEIFLD